MPTELEEVKLSLTPKGHEIGPGLISYPQLVGFIAHPNPTIRKAATENLVPYSTEQPSIFKKDELLPVKHLKFLIRDHPVSRCHYSVDAAATEPSYRKLQSTPSPF